MNFLTFILLLVAGVLAYWAWRSFFQQQKAHGSSFRPYASDELRIENVQAGGVIRIHGIGKDLDEFDLKVLARHVYRQAYFRWYELECDKGSGGKTWITVEEDDELLLSIVLCRLSLDDLGLTSNDLERIDEQERGKISYAGETFRYKDSDQALFCRYGDQEQAEMFYYWEFATKDGKKLISAERWADGDLEISYSETLKPSQITVYSIREDSDQTV